MKRWWWLFPVFAVAGVFAGVLVAGVIAYLQPKTFDSQAVVEIKPPETVLVPFDSTTPPPVGNPKFLEREMAVLKSQGVLLAAVKQLDFDRKWAVPAVDAAAIVERSITLEQLKGTDLVTIRARHVNREDARDMVLAVIGGYRDQRNSQEAGKSLSEAIREQEVKVEERRKALAEVVRTKTLLHWKEGAVPLSQGATDISGDDFVARKREFEADLELLQLLKLKYATGKASAKIGQEVLFVHEEPQVALAPSGPDLTGNLSMGIMVGVAASQVVALSLALLLPSRHQGEITPPVPGT